MTRSTETLAQVMRRLRILEDEYGFIRTHIFWVRDQEPVGLSTLQQGGRELKQVAKGSLSLPANQVSGGAGAGHRVSFWPRPPLRSSFLWGFSGFAGRSGDELPAHCRPVTCTASRPGHPVSRRPNQSAKLSPGEAIAATRERQTGGPGANRPQRDNLSARPVVRDTIVRRAFRSLLLGLAWASIWPAYLVLLARPRGWALGRETSGFCARPCFTAWPWALSFPESWPG